nr:MAG TPA: hypothetical protein [Caudoviricetes sp.]
MLTRFTNKSLFISNPSHNFNHNTSQLHTYLN